MKRVYTLYRVSTVKQVDIYGSIAPLYIRILAHQ